MALVGGETGDGASFDLERGCTVGNRLLCVLHDGQDRRSQRCERAPPRLVQRRELAAHLVRRHGASLAPTARRDYGDHAVHLKHLGVLAVHVDAVRPRQVPHVLRVRVAAVLLRRVLLQRRDLALDVAPPSSEKYAW